MKDSIDPNTVTNTEYTLSAPFIELTFDERPERFWLLASALLLLGVLVTAGLIYLYAFVLADWLGFERTVLVGIALLLIGGLANHN